jgi:hypothetical protein
VGRSIGEETEDGVLSERWLELLHAHQSRVSTSHSETKGA